MDNYMIENSNTINIVTLLASAFMFVAALSWNDAISTMIERVYPKKVDTVVAKFIYAIVVTIIVTILLYAVSTIVPTINLFYK